MSLLLLKNYINLGSIGPLFLGRILIIVFGSWGFIFLVESIYNKIYPSITKRVIQLIEDGKTPGRYQKPLLDEVEKSMGYDDA